MWIVTVHVISKIFASLFWCIASCFLCRWPDCMWNTMSKNESTKQDKWWQHLVLIIPLLVDTYLWFRYDLCRNTNHPKYEGFELPPDHDSRLQVPEMPVLTIRPSGTSKWYKCFVWELFHCMCEVTEGRVVRAGISVTWNVLSWSGGHEFEPRSGRNRGCKVLLS